MISRLGLTVSMMLVTVSGVVSAQNAKAPWEEYDKLISTSKAVTTLGPQMFGDSVDLYTGALSFATTDVSIPGNNALPVTVTRAFSVRGEQDGISNGAFGDWDIDIPNISGLFAVNWHDNRCDQAIPPFVSAPGNGGTSADTIHGEKYWKGNTANMPGGGELLRIEPSTQHPSTGGPYLWITPGRTVFECLNGTNAVDNFTGQGFLATTADGTKYWFNHLSQQHASSYEDIYLIGTSQGGPQYDSATVRRRKNTLYVTKVEDRFNNTVIYTYDNAYDQPLKVTKITASDGRIVTFHYTNGLIDSVTTGARTWSYQYTAGRLTTVALPAPEGGQWSIDLADFSQADIYYLSGAPDPNWRSCTRPGALDPLSNMLSGTITHPSGATGTFTVTPVLHGRSNVPLICENYLQQFNDTANDNAIFPFKWHAMSLTKKQITGPGLSPQLWTFAYTAGSSYFFPDPDHKDEPICQTLNCADPVCLSDSCALTDTTTIIGPVNNWTNIGPVNKWMRYTFGNSYRYNEGKLLKIEEGLGADAILRTTTNAYDLAQSGQPYAAKIGASQHPYTDGFTAEYPRPERAKVIALNQQGVSFSQTVDTGCVTVTAYCLDNFLRPTRETRSSSLGYTKLDTTTYFDQLSSWVLGQVATASTNGVEVARTDYYPLTALPFHNYSFGILQNTLTYNTDGTLAEVKDGRNYATGLSSWYRGVPRLISYPTVQNASAVVNNMGRLLSTTDEMGYISSYGYDSMDRLNRITYPVETPTWNITTLPFEQVFVPEYGIPTTHWKRMVKTGNGQVTTFYDAQWRPVLTLSEVSGDAASKSFVVNRYDEAGRLIFTSYPVDTVTSVNDSLPGSTTEYDALDRVVSVKQDSELGVLTSTTNYLSGFRILTTDPRGNSTTTSYQVFDRPDSSRPVLIQAPAGVTTTITRDVFGKPLTVTRAGPGG